MEASIEVQPSAYWRDKARLDAKDLRIGLFAPPLIEPFQPSLTLPYLSAQLRRFGLSCSNHNLSSLFYVWLFRRQRLHSMTQYNALSDAIGVLRDPMRFYDPEEYHSALARLDNYVVSSAEHDRLPYSLYPGSRASAIVDVADYEALVSRMSGTLLERFLRDYVGFTLRLEAYDVIGFSATNAFQLAASLFIAKMLKDAGIPAHLVLGGHAVSLAGPELFADHHLTKVIDSTVMGGGAEIFARVCIDVANKRAKRIYQAGDELVQVSTKGGSFPVDTPYEVTLQKDINDLYLAPAHIFSIYSALGCSYGACTFCGSNRVMAPYVPRYISVLVDEMEQLQHTHGIRHFDICDNNFDPQRAEAFCEELEQRQLRSFWQCTSRVYTTLTRALLVRMRRDGCVLMNIGLESASDRILKIMRKGYVCADVEEVLRNTEAAGMPVHLYCICSFPTESVAESEQTLAFLKQQLNRCHSVYFQNYEAELASKIFTGDLGTATDGYPSDKMIAILMDDPAIARDFVCHGNLIRRRGYPFLESHNFLYLARQNNLNMEPHT
jgi:hypothetical protein